MSCVDRVVGVCGCGVWGDVDHGVDGECTGGEDGVVESGEEFEGGVKFIDKYLLLSPNCLNFVVNQPNKAC